MASSNGNIFRATGPSCEEVAGDWWIPHTKASDTKIWCFFHLHLNKWLSKQSWGWWFETLSRSLCRRCNDNLQQPYIIQIIPLCLHLLINFTVTSHEHRGVFYQQQLDCLFNCLLRLTQKKHLISTFTSRCFSQKAGFDICFVVYRYDLLNKQSSCQWFQMP